MQPILPNGQELPDVPGAVAIGIVRPNSRSKSLSVIVRFPTEGAGNDLGGSLPAGAGDFDSLSEGPLSTVYDYDSKMRGT